MWGKKKVCFLCTHLHVVGVKRSKISHITNPFRVQAQNGQEMDASSLAAKGREAPPLVLRYSIPIPCTSTTSCYSRWLPLEKNLTVCTVTWSGLPHIRFSPHKERWRNRKRSGDGGGGGGEIHNVKQRPGDKSRALLVAVLLCSGPWLKTAGVQWKGSPVPKRRTEKKTCCVPYLFNSVLASTTLYPW